MTDTKHTPGPWTVNEATITKGHTVPHSQLQIMGDHHPHDCTLVCVFPETMTGQSPMVKANAEFIVRACNAHDALLAALRAVRAAEQAIDYPDALRATLAATLAHISKQAGAAIALATA